jgi:hypothetical protein
MDRKTYKMWNKRFFDLFSQKQLAKHRLHRVFVSYEMKSGTYNYLYWKNLLRPSTGTVTCMYATRAIGTELLSMSSTFEFTIWVNS